MACNNYKGCLNYLIPILTVASLSENMPNMELYWRRKHFVTVFVHVLGNHQMQ